MKKDGTEVRIVETEEIKSVKTCRNLNVIVKKKDTSENEIQIRINNIIL